MPSFGAKLKREREKRAITLEQISISTKIGTRMLQALEDDNFQHLPGGIFNRGFVRAYARHVGLDEDQTIADYLEASGEAIPNKPAAGLHVAEVPEDREEPAPPWRTPLGWIAAILLLIALALTLWTRPRHSNHEVPQPVPQPTSEVIQRSAPDSAIAASTQPKPVTPNPAAPSITTSNVLPASSPGEFTVIIQSTEDSWILIQIDDNSATEDTLIGESRRILHARKQLTIKAGNTGALDFTFNGKKLPSQGDYGEVRTLTFGPNGLQPNPSASPLTQ